MTLNFWSSCGPLPNAGIAMSTTVAHVVLGMEPRAKQVFYQLSHIPSPLLWILKEPWTQTLNPLFLSISMGPLWFLENLFPCWLLASALGTVLVVRWSIYLLAQAAIETAPTLLALSSCQAQPRGLLQEATRWQYLNSTCFDSHLAFWLHGFAYTHTRRGVRDRDRDRESDREKRDRERERESERGRDWVILDRKYLRE